MLRKFGFGSLVHRTARACFVALALSATTAAVAMPPPSLPPSITNTVGGVLQMDMTGGYLWEYEVFGGQSPSLSHWVLGICEDVFDDIIPGSPIGGPIEYKDPDPTTGAIGLKFDSGTEDGETKTYSFRTVNEWLPTFTTATFKSGGNVTSQSGVLAPSCEMGPENPPPPPPVPEPASMTLLAAGALPLLRRLRRPQQS